MSPNLQVQYEGEPSPKQQALKSCRVKLRLPGGAHSKPIELHYNADGASGAATADPQPEAPADAAAPAAKAAVPAASAEAESAAPPAEDDGLAHLVEVRRHDTTPAPPHPGAAPPPLTGLVHFRSHTGNGMREMTTLGEGPRARAERFGHQVNTEAMDPHALLGARIAVYWPDDALFYLGTISAYKSKTRRHTVRCSLLLHAFRVGCGAASAGRTHTSRVLGEAESRLLTDILTGPPD